MIFPVDLMPATTISCPSFTVLSLLMLDPARLFGTLNLDDMPRSQTQSPQQRAGRTPRGRGRGRGRARVQPSPLPIDPISGYAGLQYNTQHLSPNSAQTVVEGLGSTFSVHHIRPHGDGRDRYYAFQLVDPVAVRVCTFWGDSPL